MIRVQDDGTGWGGIRYWGELDRDCSDSHAISLCDGADMESGRNGTGDRGLLFVIWKTFSCEIGAAPLGDLNNDRRFDIPKQARAQVFIGSKIRGSSQNQTHRAASRTALAVEEEVTFCNRR